MVTTTADGGNGSLRAALEAIASPSGNANDQPIGYITFAPSMTGQTIRLNSELVVNPGTWVNVSASDLSAPVTIDGQGRTRIVRVATRCAGGRNPFDFCFGQAHDTRLTLTSMILTGGRAADGHRGGGLNSVD